MRPIKEQRSGLGGGRVLIIAGTDGGKLSPFVLNSRVLRGLSCFLGSGANPAEFRHNMKLTSHCGSEAAQ